jgi:hypothetical protein
MTKISAYPVLSNPEEDDILIGTDKNNFDETKNFTIASILGLVNNNLSYKVYSVSLIQTGTNNPVPTVLENTLAGNIVWTRTGVGQYIGTLEDAFPLDKTICPQFPCFNIVESAIFLNISTNTGRPGGFINAYNLDGNSISIEIYDEEGEYAEWSQTLESPFFMEIRVYN